jgi:uncharacterized RDD family membrane protein YckC
MTTTIALPSRAVPSLGPDTIALAPRGSPSLYSGMILALLALAFVLQASFLAGLASGRGGFAAPEVREPASLQMSASLLPCASP